MRYGRYNTTIASPPNNAEIQLLNGKGTVIARVDTITKEALWAHSIVGELAALELVRYHQEQELTVGSSRLAGRYVSFNYRSLFHAIEALMTVGSPIRRALINATGNIEFENVHELVDELKGFENHMNVCALNLGQFSVGICAVCELSCKYLSEVALISLGVEMPVSGRGFLHNHRMSIDPICSTCAPEMPVEA